MYECRGSKVSGVILAISALLGMRHTSLLSAGAFLQWIRKVRRATVNSSGWRDRPISARRYSHAKFAYRHWVSGTGITTTCT